MKKRYWNDKKFRASIFEKTGGKCWYCGVDGCNTIDHLTPKHVGGNDDFDNLYPSCKTCNSIKGIRTIESFRKLKWQKDNGIPYFTEHQISFLLRCGINIFSNYSPDDNKFWGEK